ncbi:hypothetical protein GWI33_014866 [Rhynchophorus ferrugineus]|uniref:C2H2-type domain-containing protein n=1 Tax=Rhynchophorus ferrugineus TaxID=354439 RepID=A0A834I4B7_RHYFE|nr:hypothetical protein GWI33_014866 [Rhynchophorus ferrugineus]
MMSILEDAQSLIYYIFYILESMYPYQCSTCLKPYKNYSSCWRHMAYECGNKKNFQCLYCSRAVAQRYDMKKHVRSCHPDKCREFEEIYRTTYYRKIPREVPSS